MLDIEILENSGFFKKIYLEKKDIVFDEGDNNNNIYIVLAGELKIEKYTNKKKSDETKILASLKKFDVFGEGALNSNNKKEVKISAKRKSVLLYINAGKGMEDFSKKYPNEAMNLLKYIIYLSNKRLLESNSLITANYKLSKDISELEEINNKKIFELIDKIKEIINVSYILYYENNPVIKNYLKLKYDTRQKGYLQDKLIDIMDNKLDLLSNNIDNYFSYIQKLSIGNNELGYLIYYKKENNFKDNDKKILTSITASIAGLIKQKQLIDEERNKEYIS